MITAEPKVLSIVDLVIQIKTTCKKLLSKWRLIFVVAFIGGIMGVTYAWFATPKYIAVLTFFTEGDSKSSLGIYAGLAAQFGLDLGGGSAGAFEGENLMEILRSRTLIKKTLLAPVDEKTNQLMIDKYLTDNKINKNWSTDEKFKNIKFEQIPKTVNRVRDSIVDKVYENIVKTDLVIDKRDKKVDLIDVKMTSSNEYFAKRFVEILTGNAISYYTNYKIKKSKQNVEILQHQTDSVKSMLYGNISDVAIMNDVNVNPLKQALRTGTQRKQVDLQANGALYAELLKNLELSKLSLRKETPLIEIVDQPTIPLKMEKPGRLLSGIIFAFVAGLLCMIGIIMQQWLIYHQIIKERIQTPKSIK